jgi:DNA topoisomerase-3
MKVVLAEKPSVARDLARILGATTNRSGYLEGNGYQVTWAIGHLVELADAKAYGYRYWSLQNLPILPQDFITKVTVDPGRAKQFEVIAELFRNADSIICATDAGREGELIFRYIYHQVGVKKPISRLWVSSQTDKAIQDGFAKLKPSSEYDNLFEAARCRSEADWLVGINATQAYTLRYGNEPPFSQGNGESNRQPVSLGRVQTPVLKLLVDRYVEARDFKAETYWEILLTLEKSGQTFQAKWFLGDRDRFYEETEGQAILSRIGNSVVVSSAEKKPKSEQPPMLYDLTELQKDANKRYNFSAQQTLDLAQDLYESYKVITYPRTDSRFLTEDIFPLMPDLIRNVGKRPAYAPFAQAILENGIEKDSRFFNDKKVSDHHAIITTETDPNSVQLPREHGMIYDLIVRRMLSAFMGNCQKELSEIVLTDAGETFKAKGTMIREEGWRAIYFALDKVLEKMKDKEKSKAGPEKKEKESEEEKELPYVEIGEVLPITEKEYPKKKTKAPSIHTESSILAMMETAGKEMEDESMREAMKDKGLGTPATRAGMIERLIQRGYVVRDKKKLIPTERGIALIRLVGDKEIASPELTGEWESRLYKMAQGQYDSGRFMEEVRQYTRTVVSASSAFASTQPQRIATPEMLMPNYDLQGCVCPKCKTGNIIKGKRAFGCSRYKEGCDFVLRPVVASKLVEEMHLRDLLAHGRTRTFVQGFISKAGKRFDAFLKFNDSYGLEFDFPPRNAGPSVKPEQNQGHAG